MSYSPHGVTYFTLNNSGKSEILIVLDEYAKSNGFVKTQDGGEYRTEEAAAILIHAVYKIPTDRGEEDFSYSVSNLLTPKCFFLGAHDYTKENSDKASKIAANVKKELAVAFGNEINFFEDQGC